MGSSSSCEGRWCSKNAEVICSCKNARLCFSCVEPHIASNPKQRHETIPINPVSNMSTTKPHAITPNHLIYNRLIYRSPEGSTEVHEGQVRGMPGKVAIKVMYCRSDSELRKRKEEADLQGGIKHSNICALYNAFLDENFQGGYKFILVMEFSESGDLEQEIEFRKLNDNFWSENDLVRHMSELLDAFAFLQSNKLTHGDIKPRNLFLSDGKYKIGDFGESRQGVQALVTSTYQVTGTVVYFSPLLFKAYLDIIKGRNSNAEVRHNPVKSDVYSLGLTFLHMASLEKPSDLNNMEKGVDLLQRNVERAIARLQYTDAVKKILSYMLQVQEHKRYDFRQLKNYITDLHNNTKLRLPNLISDSSINYLNTQESERRIDRKRSNFTGITLVSLTQTPGKASTYDIMARKPGKLNSNSFQPSSRVALYNGDIIVTGGLKTPSSTISITLDTNTSKRLPDMNVGRAWHAVCIQSTYLYVIGGRSRDKANAIKAVERFDFEKWETLPELNIERENATAVNFKNVIYVIGGSNKEHGRWELLSSIERYQDNAWQILSFQLPCKMAGVGLVQYGEDKILLLGGSRERGTFSPEVFAFSLEDGSEETFSNLPEGDAFWTQAVYQTDESIIVMGTMIGIYVYTKETNNWELRHRY